MVPRSFRYLERFRQAFSVQSHSAPEPSNPVHCCDGHILCQMHSIQIDFVTEKIASILLHALQLSALHIHHMPVYPSD